MAITLVKGIFKSRESFAEWLFEPDTLQHPNIKSPLFLWSITTTPTINQVYYIEVCLKTKEFFPLEKPNLNLLNIVELTMSRLECILTQNITDEQFSQIECENPRIKLALCKLIESKRMIHDKSTSTLQFPYQVPVLSKTAEIKDYLKNNKVNALFISPSGMLHLNSEPTPFLIRCDGNKMFKVTHMRKNELHLNGKRRLATSVRNAQFVSTCTSDDYKQFDLSDYDVLVFIDRYVFREDAEHLKKFCCYFKD